MEASIFDVLSGGFASDRPVRSVREEDRLLWSVLSNLNRLLNTRRGSVKHLPDYGLPDLKTVYQDSPQSEERLRKEIEESIRTYEPRLRRVRVECREGDDFEMRLAFTVRAVLESGNQVRFKTTFESQRSAEIKPVGTY